MIKTNSQGAACTGMGSSNIIEPIVAEEGIERIVHTRDLSAPLIKCESRRGQRCRMGDERGAP